MRPTKQIPLKNAKPSDSPTFMDKPEWLTVEQWLHWDQNPWGQPNFKGVQGLLALSNSTEDTGGFLCVPGSHLVMKEWGEKNKHHSHSVEFVEIPRDDSLYKFTQKITLRKGSFVVWDSRTLHANYANRSSQFRIVQYITYFTALKDSEDENEGDTKKMRTFQVRAWGHQGHYPPPVLTHLGEKLLGARNWSTGKLDCDWKKPAVSSMPVVGILILVVITSLSLLAVSLRQRIK